MSERYIETYEAIDIIRTMLLQTHGDIIAAVYEALAGKFVSYDDKENMIKIEE